MRYDTDDIKLRVETKKRELITRIIVSALIIISAIALISFNDDTTLVFACVMAILITIIYIIRHLIKNSPKILYSKEMRGENVKEDEYLIGGSRLMRYGGYRFTYNHSRHKGDVFVKLDDGSFAFFTCLPKSHLDIYEIGDTLVKYAGVRYPVAENSAKEKMPCPICGNINSSGQECCSSCGLKIIKN